MSSINLTKLNEIITSNVEKYNNDKSKINSILKSMNLFHNKSDKAESLDKFKSEYQNILKNTDNDDVHKSAVNILQLFHPSNDQSKAFRENYTKDCDEIIGDIKGNLSTISKIKEDNKQKLVKIINNAPKKQNKDRTS
jgi:hypothetical protein